MVPTGIGGSGSTRWCRGQYLRYNATYSNVYPARSVACHELAHTMGLQHNYHSGASGDSCTTTSPPIPDYLSEHDVNHLKSNY